MVFPSDILFSAPKLENIYPAFVDYLLFHSSIMLSSYFVFLHESPFYVNTWAAMVRLRLRLKIQTGTAWHGRLGTQKKKKRKERLEFSVLGIINWLGYQKGKKERKQHFLFNGETAFLLLREHNGWIRVIDMTWIHYYWEMGLTLLLTLLAQFIGVYGICSFWLFLLFCLFSRSTGKDWLIDWLMIDLLWFPWFIHLDTYYLLQFMVVLFSIRGSILVNAHLCLRREC